MAEYKKRIVHNFISLSFVQGLSMLFPLITFPYLLRVLGVESFGVFTLIQTVVLYFDLLISFGFGLTATKYITRSINDIEKTREVITAVYIIKLLLFAFTMLVFLGSSIFIPYLRHNFLLVLISFIYLMGNLLFPDWYFQGIQKMRSIAVVAFLSKSVGLVLIILLVRNSNDIAYALLAVSAGNFISGLVGFMILRRSVSVKIKIPKKIFIVSLFKESGYVFTSIILAPFYSSVNLFILQIFSNPLMVGYYAVSEKIFSAIGMLTSIANRTFYPHLSLLYSTSLQAYKQNIKKILTLFFIAFVILAGLQFFTAGYIIKLVSGTKAIPDITYSVVILQILSIGQLFSPYASFFFQILIIQGQKKEAIRNITAAVFINLLSAGFFAYFYGGKGMAINLCMIVFFIGLLNFIAFNKKLTSLSIPS
ncbi:MAG: oligosaccharide flippase family protein [Taibaiella sp.]|nr:oligosaccharide flippase family protein [Taibaiella sp.]